MLPLEPLGGYELPPLEPLGGYELPPLLEPEVLGYALLELPRFGQSAPVQSAELEAELPCVVVEALPEAEAPELGDAGAVLAPLPVEAPADVLLPALLPLCAHPAASIAATTATPIAFNAI